MDLPFVGVRASFTPEGRDPKGAGAIFAGWAFKIGGIALTKPKRGQK